MLTHRSTRLATFCVGFLLMAASAIRADNPLDKPHSDHKHPEHRDDDQHRDGDREHGDHQRSDDRHGEREHGVRRHQESRRNDGSRQDGDREHHERDHRDPGHPRPGHRHGDHDRRDHQQGDHEHGHHDHSEHEHAHDGHHRRFHEPTHGLRELRDAINSELRDVADSLRNLNQSYAIRGMRGCGAWTAGSAFLDCGHHCQHATSDCRGPLLSLLNHSAKVPPLACRTRGGCFQECTWGCGHQSLTLNRERSYGATCGQPDPCTHWPTPTVDECSSDCDKDDLPQSHSVPQGQSLEAPTHAPTSGPAFVTPTSAATVDGCDLQFQVELDAARPDHLIPILMQGEHWSTCNFLVGQYGDELRFRFRAETPDQYGLNVRELNIGRLGPGRHDVAIRLSDAQVELTIDDGTTHTLPVDGRRSNWHPNAPLVVDASNWNGQFELTNVSR